MGIHPCWERRTLSLKKGTELIVSRCMWSTISVFKGVDSSAHAGPQCMQVYTREVPGLRSALPNHKPRTAPKRCGDHVHRAHHACKHVAIRTVQKLGTRMQWPPM